MSQPTILRLARALILLDGVLWLAFASIIAAGVHPSYPRGSDFLWPMAAGGLLGAIVMLGIARLLRNPSRLAYWASVAVLAGMLLAGLFDQVGLADVAFMSLTLVPLALLVKERAWYLRSELSEGPLPTGTH